MSSGAAGRGWNRVASRRLIWCLKCVEACQDEAENRNEWEYVNLWDYEEKGIGRCENRFGEMKERN